MTPVEWGVLVERLGHIYPAQVLPAETVNAWYDELADFDAEQVWQAMRRLIRTRPRWLFDAIANLCDALAELDRERRAMAAQERAAQQRPVRRQHGAPCPPEFGAALAVLKRRLAGELDAVSANETIQALADQLEARTGDQPTTEPDYCPPWALRSCPDCATSPAEGFVPTTLAVGDPNNAYPWPVEVYAPCLGCNPIRAEVAKAGQLHLAHDRAGRPTGWSRDGNAAHP
jgi:hypothetical protein